MYTFLGSRVIIAGRSEEAAKEAIEDIQRSAKNCKIEFLKLNLASFASVRSFAKTLLESKHQNFRDTFSLFRHDCISQVSACVLFLIGRSANDRLSLQQRWRHVATVCCHRGRFRNSFPSQFPRSVHECISLKYIMMHELVCTHV